MMTRFPYLGLALAAALAACGGGDDDDDGPDDGGGLTSPPTETSMVADEGFDSPSDAVASLDGATFFFSAYTDEAAPRPGIFSVPSGGGDVTLLAGGSPLEAPPGLLLSRDGSKLYAADVSVPVGELEDGQSLLYTIDTSGGALSALAIEGVREVAGLALGPEEDETIYLTGYNLDGEPALFTVPATGGSATEVAAGAPFESPSGVYVSDDQVSWVMDHRPSHGLGGILWAVTPEGETSEVVANLGLAARAGVSLVAGGGTAVIPNYTEDEGGQLLTVNIASGEQTIVQSTMKDPAGIRTAREAARFAVVDSDGNAIYSAQ